MAFHINIRTFPLNQFTLCTDPLTQVTGNGKLWEVPKFYKREGFPAETRTVRHPGATDLD